MVLVVKMIEQAMNKINWRWLAGFTDGKGSIGIVGRETRITWGQNNKQLIDYLVEFLKKNGFHPNYYFVEPKPPRRKNRIYICNLVRQSEIIRIIDILEPLIILKFSQCQKVRLWLLQHVKTQNYDFINKEQIIKWATEGYSGRWMAEQLDCERQKIYKYARKYGIKLHPAGGKSINGKRLPNV